MAGPFYCVKGFLGVGAGAVTREEFRMGWHLGDCGIHGLRYRR